MYRLAGCLFPLATIGPLTNDTLINGNGPKTRVVPAILLAVEQDGAASALESLSRQIEWYKITVNNHLTGLLSDPGSYHLLKGHSQQHWCTGVAVERGTQLSHIPLRRPHNLAIIEKADQHTFVLAKRHHKIVGMIWKPATDQARNRVYKCSTENKTTSFEAEAIRDDCYL